MGPFLDGLVFGLGGIVAIVCVGSVLLVAIAVYQTIRDHRR